MSAPGKLLLAGEYAVLDGHEALVAAVSARLVAELGPLAGEDDGSPPPAHRSPEIAGLPPEVVVARERAQSAYAMTGHLATTDPALRAPLRLDRSALAQGGIKLGLGSSAAGAVAAVGAVASAAGLDPAAERARIFELAFEGHAAVAPQGSGADVAASAFGGLIGYRRPGGDRGPAARPLRWPEGLLARAVWTGRAARTSDLVALVEALRAREPGLHARRIGAIAEAAEALIGALEGGDLPGLLEAARAHHGAMRALGEAAGAPIVTEALEGIAQAAEAAGGAAKPSGAGGGDVALFFFTEPAQEARFLAQREAPGCASAGSALLSLSFGEEGVRREPEPPEPPPQDRLQMDEPR